jgi:hypothetical protein
MLVNPEKLGKTLKTRDTPLFSDLTFLVSEVLQVEKIVQQK